MFTVQDGDNLKQINHYIMAISPLNYLDYVIDEFSIKLAKVLRTFLFLVHYTTYVIVSLSH